MFGFSVFSLISEAISSVVFESREAKAIIGKSSWLGLLNPCEELACIWKEREKKGILKQVLVYVGIKPTYTINQ